MRISFFILSLFFALANAFANDGVVSVKDIKGRQAHVDAKDLKVGDLLYFARSPFKFPVEAVNGSDVTLTLPERHDLTVGSSLLRKPTEAIKKSISTEAKLKSALEE